MTTVKEYLTENLKEGGMWPDMADQVMAAHMADPAMTSMAGRWNDAVDDYPMEMKAIWIMGVHRAAIIHIDANMPLLWCRRMFLPISERMELLGC